MDVPGERYLAVDVSTRTRQLEHQQLQHLQEKRQHQVSEDLRCSLESTLASTLAESDGIFPREGWIQFLQLIGGSELDTQALLKDQESHLSVDEFLNVIFGQADTSDTRQAKKDGKITGAANLRDYFEKHYRQGGEFRHPDYKVVRDSETFTWRHRSTDIQVWRDAIDLTSGEGGEVYFHYTSELAFRNITAPSKKAAEVWASLNSEPGPNQNAWWGKGIYSVPLPPDQWRDRDQLLDNNFRNMMARDRASPDKCPRCVKAQYRKRVAFCVPIIIDAASAYDVSVRATPEMEAAGKEPGRNLGDKLLNEPGMPPRCCVVLQVQGEDGVKHAEGQLLDVLRHRAASSTDLTTKDRLGSVLNQRGLYHEALPIWQEVFAARSKFGPESPGALASMHNLAICLRHMGRFGEAVELQRRVLTAREAKLGLGHSSAVKARNSLANTLDCMGNHGEAIELHRNILKIRRQSLGAEHLETLKSMNNLGRALANVGKLAEAAWLQRRVLQIWERTLGAEHPHTLGATSSLGHVLFRDGKFSEAAELDRKVVQIQEKTLGPEHPSTLNSMNTLGCVLFQMGKFDEAAQLHTKTLEIQERTQGPEHPETLSSLANLGDALFHMGNYDRGARMARTALEIKEKTLGPEHPSTLGSMNSLGCILFQMNKYKEAAEIQRSLVQIQERTQGSEHPATLASRSNLGQTLDKMGRHQEAVELLRNVFQTVDIHLGPRHPLTLVTIRNFGTALRNMGDCAEAATLHRMALVAQEETLGAENPYSLVTLSELAVTLHRQGELNEAMEMQRRALSGMEKAFGPDHYEIKQSQQRLDEVLQDMGLKGPEEDDKHG